jgi:hypothetical protein
MSDQRAELGIDGNCGFALLGENIQDGEAIARVRADPTGEEAMKGIRPVRLLLDKIVDAARPQPAEGCSSNEGVGQ